MTSFNETNNKIEALWKQWPEGAPTLTLVARRDSRPGDENRETHILKRGEGPESLAALSADVPLFIESLRELPAEYPSQLEGEEPGETLVMPS